MELPSNPVEGGSSDRARKEDCLEVLQITLNNQMQVEACSAKEIRAKLKTLKEEVAFLATLAQLKVGFKLLTFFQAQLLVKIIKPSSSSNSQANLRPRAGSLEVVSSKTKLQEDFLEVRISSRPEGSLVEPHPASPKRRGDCLETIIRAKTSLVDSSEALPSHLVAFSEDLHSLRTLVDFSVELAKPPLPLRTRQGAFSEQINRLKTLADFSVEAQPKLKILRADY